MLKTTVFISGEGTLRLLLRDFIFSLYVNLKIPSEAILQTLTVAIWTARDSATTVLSFFIINIYLP